MYAKKARKCDRAIVDVNHYIDFLNLFKDIYIYFPQRVNSIDYYDNLIFIIYIIIIINDLITRKSRRAELIRSNSLSDFPNGIVLLRCVITIIRGKYLLGFLLMISRNQSYSNFEGKRCSRNVDK